MEIELKHINTRAYKKTIDLIEQFVQSTQKVPKSVKYNMIYTTHNELIKMCGWVGWASCSVDDCMKKEKLQSVMEYLCEFKIIVRILNDLHYITTSGFSAIILLENELESQIKGWLKSLN